MGFLDEGFEADWVAANAAEDHFEVAAAVLGQVEGFPLATLHVRPSATGN